MEVKIVATTGRARGHSVAIRAAKFFIGRHENCQLRPDIPGLAGIHALIEEREGRHFLRDFGVEGGTGLNDRVLHAREAEVFDGDLIQVGPMVLDLSIKPKGEATPGLAHAPEGWPYFMGEVAEDVPAPRPGAREAPVETRSPVAKVVSAPAMVVVEAAPVARPPSAPLSRPIPARVAGHRALECRTVDDVLVVTLVSPNLSEEETVSPVRYELRSLLEKEDTPGRTVIDLGNTRYLSSRAVGVILAHYQGLERKGATMRVCRVSPEIQPVLDQMRLSMLIDLYPTVEEAVTAPWD